MSKDFEAVVRDTEIPPEDSSHEDSPGSDQDKVDVRAEVFSQIKLLKSLRDHLFLPNGTPKKETEFKDIRSYLSSSTQLLGMLQKFEEVLNTDADFSKMLRAIELAMEDCACPEFVEKLKYYMLAED